MIGSIFFVSTSMKVSLSVHAIIILSGWPELILLIGVNCNYYIWDIFIWGGLVSHLVSGGTSC